MFIRYLFTSVLSGVIFFVLVLPCWASSPITLPDHSVFQKIEARARQTHTTALLIYKNGKQVFKYGNGKSKPIPVYSITKSMVSLAIGILKQKGLIQLDAPIHTYFPEWNQGLKKKITVKHILTQTSGLQDENTFKAIYASPDFVQFALCADVIAAPGTQFFYNNKAVNLLPAIVQKITHIPLDVLLRDEIFKPLGIQDYQWEKDQAGNVRGMSGLHLLPEDLIKIGSLILNKGMKENKKILDPSYLADLFKPSQDLNSKLSYLWWIQGDDKTQPLALCAIGYLGQRLYIIPSRQIVAVRLFDEQGKTEAEIKMGEADTFEDLYTMLLDIP